MKKIITFFVLFFAFSINASAQDKSLEFEISAKKDLELLTNVIPVESNMQMIYFELFLKKHQDLNAPNITEARKIQISSNTDAKLRSSLSKDQVAKLEDNKKIYEYLISKPSSKEEVAKKK